MSIESVMPSNHLIFCHPLLLMPPIPPSIRVFSNELVFHFRWPKYWSFCFSISPSNEYSGLISFRIDYFELLAVQRTSRRVFILFYFIYLFFLVFIFLILKSLILTCGPKHEPPSHLPPHNISVGHPHAPAPSMLYPASDIDWRFNSYVIVYMLECHSLSLKEPSQTPQFKSINSSAPSLLYGPTLTPVHDYSET